MDKPGSGTIDEHTIGDIRGTEDPLSLDRHGFAYRSMKSGFSDFERKKRIVRESEFDYQIIALGAQEDYYLQAWLTYVKDAKIRLQISKA